MKKRKIGFMLLLLLCNSSLLLAQHCRIGDLIENADGSKGVVFWVNAEGTGGWMVAMNDSPSCRWDVNNNPSDIPALENPTDAELMGYVDGYKDTKIIREAGNASQFPAAWAMSSLGEEWYLPAIGQLRMLFSRLALIDNVLEANGGSTLSATQYWSSTKYNNPQQPGDYKLVRGIATLPNNDNGALSEGALIHPLNKTIVNAVRAVRDFSIFEWNTVPPVPKPLSYADTLKVIPTETTTYTLTVTMGLCDPVQTNVEVVVSPVPKEVTITPEGPLSICDGDEIQLQAQISNNGNWTYAWSDLTTGQTFSETNAVLTVNDLSLGLHEIQVVVSSETNDNCNGSATVEVEVFPPIEAILTGTSLVCVNTPFDLVATPTGEGLTYSWTRNGVVMPGWTGATVPVTENATGTYEYTVTISDGICTDESEPFTVVIEEIVPTLTGPARMCVDTQFDLVAAPTGEGLTYIWKRNGVEVPEWTGPQAHPSEATVGQYVYTVTVSDGICTAESEPLTVEVEDLTANASGPVRVCVGSEFILEASPAINTYSYIWKRNGVVISETGSSLFMTENNVGTYDYTVTISDGICTDESEPLTITVEDLTATLTGPQVACVNIEFNLVAGPTDGYSYTWKRNGVPTSWMTATVPVTESTAGQYDYTVTITNGICTDNASWTVHVEQVIALIEGPANVCPGETVTLTAKPDGMSYQWSNGSTGQSITVPAGNYTVTVTSTDGCSNDASHTVTEYSSFTATIEGPLQVCPGETVTLTAKPDGMSYQWSNGSTGQSITVPAGNYNVTVTSTDGCSNDASHTVTEYSSFTATIEGPPQVCPGETVTLIAKPDGMNYLWSNGSTGQSITAPAGNYTVTVTSTDGCSNDASHTVTLFPAVEASIEGLSLICPGNQVTLIAKPDGMASYVWNTGATGQTITVTPTEPTTNYSVTVTSSDGCQGDAMHEITLSESVNSWIDGPTSVCPDNVVTLIAKPDGMASYVWNTGETTQDITVPMGTYSVTVTSNDGCEGSATHTVAELPSVTASIEGDNAVCEGSPITLTAKPDGMTYLWSNGSTDQTITVTPGAPSETFDVTVTSADGCFDNVSHTVTVKPLPVADASASDTHVDYGGVATLRAADAGSDAVYHWSPEELIATGQGTATATTGPLTDPTTFYLTVTLDGCESPAPDEVTVTVGDALYATVSADPTSVCEGGTTTLTAIASNGTGNYNYSWTPTELIESGQGTSQVVTKPLEMPMTFTCTVDDGNETISPEVTVMVFPSVTATIEGETSVCEGSTITLIAKPDGMSYLWSNGMTDQTITVTPDAPSTTYSVTVTSADGCSNDATHVVTLKPLPIADASGSDTNVDYGASATLRAADAGSDAVYHWSPEELIATGQGTATATTGPLTDPTTFYLTVTLDGCESAVPDEVTVTVGDALYATVTADPASVCEGGTTTLTATASNGTGNYNYSWTPTELIENGQGTSQVVTKPLDITTTFTCTVDDGNETISPEVTVMVFPSVTATIEGETSVCEGSTIMLTAKPDGMSYLWSNGMTDQTITLIPDAPSTAYSVTVTSADGCSNDATHVVTLKPLPIADASGSDTNVDYGASATLRAADAGSDAVYHWSPEELIATGQGTATATTGPLTDPTTFYLTVTVDGCESAMPDQVTVTVGDALYATVTADPASVCEGGTTTLTATASNGTGNYTYSWTPTDLIGSGQGTSQVTTTSLDMPTTFTCVVDDGNETASPQVTVSVFPAVTASIEGETSVCEGSPVSLTAKPDGMNYLWSNGMTDQTITVTPDAPSMTYAVTVTSVDGCSNDATHTVTVKPLPIADASGSDTNVDYGAPATLRAADAGPGAEYHWSPEASIVSGQGTAMAITEPLTEPKTFYLTVTLDGCESAAPDEVTVTVGDALFASAMADPSSICPGSITTLGVTVTGGSGDYTYDWQPQVFIDGDNTTQTVTTTALDADQPFTCTVTDEEGVTFTAPVTVTMKPVPIADASGSDHYSASGTTVTLVAADAGEGAQYYWEPEDLIDTGLDAMVATTQPLVGPGPYQFYLTVTSSDGCTNYDTVTVIIGDELDVAVTTDPVCRDEAAVLKAEATGGTGQYNYQWEPSEYIAYGQNESQATTIGLTEDKTFDVTVSDGYASIKASVTVTVETPVFDTIPQQTACLYYVWFDNDTLTQAGYHDYVVPGLVCDTTFVLYLEIVDEYNDTIPKTACDFYDWNENTYFTSGCYTDTLVSEQGCDSIVTLKLDIINPNLQILGYKDIFVASDVWHGIYHYYVVDSISIPLAPIQWQCDNPDWIVLQMSDYHCKLIATTEGSSWLTSHTLIADNCDEEMSILINATPYYDDVDTPVALFPNPARSKVTVQAEGMTRVRMVDLMGQVLKDVEVKISNSIDIDTGTMKRGVYLVEITTVNEVIIKRLILAKH